jgi:Carboxypeptidase regulatory-like domain
MNNLSLISAFCVGALLLPLADGPPDAKPKIIRGLVTDEANAPLPNALIELNCPKEKASAQASTKSNADGRFQFEATLHGMCKVKITAPGFSTLLVPIPDSPKRAVTDLGKIRLSVSCSGPGVICDEVTPTEAPPRLDQMTASAPSTG